MNDQQLGPLSSSLGSQSTRIVFFTHNSPRQQIFRAKFVTCYKDAFGAVQNLSASLTTRCFLQNLQSLPSMPDYQAEKGIEAFIALFCWLYFSFGNFRSGFLFNYAVFVSLMSQTTRSDSWRNSMWMEMVERSLSMENNW